jgi:hypothetical protein
MVRIGLLACSNRSQEANGTRPFWVVNLRIREKLVDTQSRGIITPRSTCACPSTAPGHDKLDMWHYLSHFKNGCSDYQA